MIIDDMTIAKSNIVVPRFHFKKTDYQKEYIDFCSKNDTHRRKEQKHHVIPRKVKHHFGNKTYTVRLSDENHKIAHFLLNISYAQNHRRDLYNELGYGINLIDCSYVKNFINKLRVCKKGDDKWFTIREVYKDLKNNKNYNINFNRFCIRFINRAICKHEKYFYEWKYFI